MLYTLQCIVKCKKMKLIKIISFSVLLQNMGCLGSKDRLTKEDMDFLKSHTRYDETTIKEWYKGFKVCKNLLLNFCTTFLYSTFFEKTVSKLFIAAQTFRFSSIFDFYFLSQLSQFLRYNQVLGLVGTTIFEVIFFIRDDLMWNNSISIFCYFPNFHKL
jgi:hypothetical protein